MSVDAKVMTVVGAIKQSIEQSASPGVSVNSHPNPFFLNVNGAFDLKAAATLIIQRLEEYETALKARIEKSIKEAEAKLAAEAANVAANDTSTPA
jgi:hypothetical protein